MRRGLVVTAALLAALLPLVLSPAAAGRPAAGSQPVPELQLVEQAAWTHSGEAITLQVRVRGAPPDATVGLEVHRPLRSRSAFTATLADEPQGRVAQMPPQTLESMQPVDVPDTYELSYPVGVGGAGLDADDDFGVYPVTVSVSTPGGEVLDQFVTYLLLLPDDVEDYDTLALGLLVEVGAAPGLQPSGSTSISDADRDAVEQRLDMLTAAQELGLPLTVAPVPETLDALDDLGQRGDTEPVVLPMGTPGQQVLARPYVDLDIDGLTHAGMLGPVASAEADAGARVVRSRLGVEPTGGVWLTGPTVSGAEAAGLLDLNVGRAVVPSSAIASIPGEDDAGVPLAPVNLTERGPLALVSDDALVERLAGEDGALDAQRFVAELAMIWREFPSRGGRGVMVRIPETTALNPDLVRRALAGVSEGSAVLTPMTVDGMYTALPPIGGADQPQVAELAPDDESGDNLGPVLQSMTDAQVVLGGLAGMLDDGPLVTDLQRSLLIAPGARTPASERPAYVARVDETAAALAAEINAPAEFKITLTARDGTIPLTIDNTSDQDIEVEVRLSSNQLEFPDGELLDVVVPPGGKRIDLDVRTRTSGAFPLGITITSPDGSIILDRTTFTIRSTAISGVGLVLSIGAGLFLLIWWARHWRTARRSSRLIPTHPSARGRDLGAGTRFD